MKVFILILLTLLASCSAQQAEVLSPTPTPIPSIPIVEQPPEPSTEERISPLPENTPRKIGVIEKKLEKYFDSHEIKPLLTIENDYNGARKNRTEEVKVSNHLLTWYYSIKTDRGPTIETLELKIDDDLITIEDKSSLNGADGGGKISGNIVNNWRKIKFYKVNGRELIGIEMGNEFCTGLMCSVTFFLVYDLETKSQNFFGDFRIDNELKLYDFGKDGMIDFLGTKNDFTYTPGFKVTNIYSLYTLDKKGIFQLQKDSSRKPYFIKRVFSSNDDSEFNDKFEQSWIEKIEL